ncbi:hypothetical protein [Providencia huaxiensis]|uniref:hypothetical protein n=1 Tax=Providencia huaxiensis TaxID=2027290 RepID=UPI0034E4AB50
MSDKLDNRAFNLFKIFAQYEFFLKMHGFTSERRDGSIKLDWDKFSNEIGAQIFENKHDELQAAINYLFNAPPKKQILKEGKLSWQGQEKDTDIKKTPQLLFSYIRRVRNNLYHGGKFSGHWFDPERSETLINSSLIILESLKEMHHPLMKATKENHA